jgi:hypothetical protein
MSSRDIIQEYYNFVHGVTDNHLLVVIDTEHMIVVPEPSVVEHHDNISNVFDNTSGLIPEHNIRFNNIDILERADIIVQYTMPNLLYARTSERYSHLAKKMIYIPPLLIIPPYNHENHHRSHHVIMTCMCLHPENRPRRFQLFEELKARQVPIENVNHLRTFNALHDFMMDTKILVNVHQTDFHHSFEEFRCLPALLCRVIIISERPPLWETIPFHSFIIWCSYEEIADTVEYVLANYDSVYEEMFVNRADEFLSLHKQLRNLIKL